MCPETGRCLHHHRLEDVRRKATRGSSLETPGELLAGFITSVKQKTTIKLVTGLPLCPLFFLAELFKKGDRPSS